MHSAIDSPVASPMERRGVIEIDTFCTGCHYNLHGQVVTIDDRLGFPVCQCPECGKYHPAGTGVTASGVWLRRFASLLLFLWIVVVLGCTIAIGGTMAGLDAGSVGIFSYSSTETPDGQPVVYANPTGPAFGGGYVIAGTHILAPHFVWYERLHPWYNTSSSSDDPGLSAMAMLSAGSLVLGFLAATLFVSLLWHWQRRRYTWLIVLAILPASLDSIFFITLEQFHLIRLQCLEHVYSQTAIQCIGMTLGIFFGRRLARLLVLMVVPPKPRQALAFLWLVDGLNPPRLAEMSKLSRL